MSRRLVHTAGHSNRTLAALVELLAGAGVRLVVDVRRYQVSRRHPQFSREAFERGLGAAGLDYLWLPGLGGHREPRGEAASSPHRALANPVWRGYAEHMDTDEFAAALAALEARAATVPAVVLCAEAEPASCHRRFIADALVARGWRVEHLVGSEPARAHELSRLARVEAGGRLRYDGGQRMLF